MNEIGEKTRGNAYRVCGRSEKVRVHVTGGREQDRGVSVIRDGFFFIYSTGPTRVTVGREQRRVRGRRRLHGRIESGGGHGVFTRR